LGGTGTAVPRWAKLHPPLGRHLLVGWAVLSNDPRLLGVVGSNPDPWFSPTPAWRRYTADFHKAFPNVFDPSLNNQPYYDAVEPVLEALAQVHGDLSGGERRFASALAHLRYHSPEGLITLDARHQAIAPIYLYKVERRHGGGIHVKQIGELPHVHQTLDGYFSPTSPAPSFTQPACHRGVHGT